MDTPKNILLDEEKYSRIQQLENTGEYYFNQKFDGLRIGLGKTTAGAVTIPNRRGVDYAVTKNVPDIEAIAQMFPPDTMLDGEIYCAKSDSLNLPSGLISVRSIFPPLPSGLISVRRQKQINGSRDEMPLLERAGGYAPFIGRLVQR